MKRAQTRLHLRAETIRELTAHNLVAAKGGLAGWPNEPSDGVMGHCWSDYCSGNWSCEPADCTISLSG